MTLTEFLLARLAEDEEWAREAPPHATEGACWCHRVPEGVLVSSPARVLAECEAKRQIVAQVVDLDQHDGYTEATRDAVLALAAIYADHPDYRPEWKP